MGAVAATGEQGTDSGQSILVEETAEGEGDPQGLSSARFVTLGGLSRPGLRNRNFPLKNENELEGVMESPDKDPEGEGGAKLGDGNVEKVWQGVLY